MLFLAGDSRCLSACGTSVAVAAFAHFYDRFEIAADFV